MKVMLSGANGFVGLNIVDALIESGHQVRAYVRETSNVDYLSAFDIEIHRGELTDRTSLNNAVEGMDGVIHTAGNTSCYESAYPQLHAVNVNGTRAVVEAAKTQSVRRFVFTSTTSTIGAQNDQGYMANENTRLDGFRSRSPYARTKLEAETLVLNSSDRDFETVVVNPAEVVGPFDHNLQWGRMVLAVYFNRVPFVPRGGGTFSCARAVGKAHVNALENGRARQRYILGGVHSSYENFLETISEVTEQKFERPRRGFKTMYLKGLLQEKFGRLRFGRPVVEPYRMRVFDGHYYFDSGKAIKELNYETSNTLRDMVVDCFRWYRANGIVPP